MFRKPKRTNNDDVMAARELFISWLEVIHLEASLAEATHSRNWDRVESLNNALMREKQSVIEMTHVYLAIIDAHEFPDKVSKWNHQS